jgi:hypothetical protein
VASEYHRVDAGADDCGKNWIIGVRGADVEVTVDPTAVSLTFGAAGREQFQRAFMAAERAAGTYDPAHPS